MTATKCEAPSCDRPAAWAGLCPGHYQQRRRHPDRDLVPLRDPDAESAFVRFRCPAELKGEVEAAARKAGVDASVVWRKAAETWIERGEGLIVADEARPVPKRKKARGR